MPLSSYENLPSKILCIDIGSASTNTDYMRWTRTANENVFPMDIQAGRQMAKEHFFLHLEKSDRRMVFIKDRGINFLIMAEVEVQIQMLEAILEEVINTFFDAYGTIYKNFFTGMKSIFDGFKSTINTSINEAQETRVRWIKSKCTICKQDYYICVKKSLIENAKSFPVSLVFQHGGHGLLIYLDSKFKTRGNEIVEITG